MTDQQILEILKLDLQISTNNTALTTRLTTLIAAAKEYIQREGIEFETPLPVGDGMLIEMYAAYLYRARREDKNGGMPRMLRYALNCRLLKDNG